jgi:hypothetical protein
VPRHDRLFQELQNRSAHGSPFPDDFYHFSAETEDYLGAGVLQGQEEWKSPFLEKSNCRW